MGEPTDGWNQARVAFEGVAAIFAARSIALRFERGAISGVLVEAGARIC